MAEPWCFLKEHCDEAFIKNLCKNGFNEPTEVQIKVIPELLGNKDVSVIATTGTGKTLCFVISSLLLVERTYKKLKKHATYILILCPTRELAFQTFDVFAKVSTATKIKPFLLNGGYKTRSCLEYTNNGGHVMISTPGVLAAIFSRIDTDNTFRDLLATSFLNIELLVLDEADKHFDLGLAKQLSIILNSVPRLRRTAMFSATDSPEAKKFASSTFRNPLFIKHLQPPAQLHTLCSTVAPLKPPTSSLPTQLKNYFAVCGFKEKFSVLCQFLADHKNAKTIVFCASALLVDYLGLLIPKLTGRNVLLLHGKMGKKRLAVFSSFLGTKRAVLVCSDLMARGIDIPKVDWIVQFNPPTRATAFLHRSGRTARMDNEGNCVTLLYSNELDYIHFISLNQGIELEELIISDVTSYSNRIKRFAVSDRDVYFKGLKAFVSFVNFYIHHECKHIFDLKALELGKIATDFGLLHLPAMPELEGANLEGFSKTEIDRSNIKFKNKAREKLRLKILKSKLKLKE